MLEVFGDGLWDGSWGRGIEVGELGGRGIILLLCNIEFVNNVVFIFGGEVVRGVWDDVEVSVVEGRMLFGGNVDEERVLESCGRDGGRVKVVNE